MAPRINCQLNYLNQYLERVLLDPLVVHNEVDATVIRS